MGKGCRRGGVGQVVRRDVDRLHGGDRSALRGGDALLQLAHLIGERGLIAHGGGHPPEQRGDLAARLHKAEDIIDEQQHVALLLVAEIFRHGKPRERHAHTNARRLVHLPEDERGLVDHAALVHLAPEVVALAAALAHAGKDRVPAVFHGDIVDQLLNKHRFPHARAAEQADLAAARIGLQQIDDLDACFENVNARVLLEKRGRLAVDAAARRIVRDGCAAVNRVAEHIEQPAERRRADRHAQPAALTSMPRARPSLPESITQRAVSASRCCATSIRQHLPFSVTESASRMRGSPPPFGKRTSTTLPAT